MKIHDLPKDKHYKFLLAAFEAALLCPGAGRNFFRLGSVLVYKKYIHKISFNSGKTHPKLLRFSKYPFIHAESSAILSYGLDNCRGMSLYTVRILHNNEIALAKPCKVCQSLIDYVGIKKVYYSTPEGYNNV